MTRNETTLQATYDAMLTEGVAVVIGLAMLVALRAEWIAMGSVAHG